jgi:iron complex outermembrane receptor protein
MKRFFLPFVAATLVSGFSVANLQAEPEPQANLGKAADNNIFAQTLVNQTMANHPELVVIGLHAIAPGATGETMIATNLDRIGKKDDDDDIAVATERKTILAPNLTDASRFEVQVPMHDASGKVIGAIGLVFKYKAGDDEVQLHVKAVAIRDELAAQIATFDDLFKPAK